MPTLTRLRRLPQLVVPLVFATLVTSGAWAAREALPGVGEVTAGLEVHRGLLTLHLDRQRGQVWLELPAAGGPEGEVGQFLYVESLLNGLGSNPVGLDRGQLGDTRLVRLRRVGGRLLVEQLNTRFRASADSAQERRAVHESFARSVLWAGPLAAEDAGGRFLVDFTSFLLRDAHGVAATLAATGQGNFQLDPERSAVDLDAILAFPDNLEIDAVLTYRHESDKLGAFVRETVPSPHSVTLVQHHSLVRLPAPGFVPRAHHPRSGASDLRFLDYSTPLDEPVERRLVTRHRLQKTNPAAERSPVVEPIVFYLDSGTPEPVRSALLEGASWWADAFSAAGFVDAYRVELLPPDVHPLDVRYNVIQWVHRSTRGWSYGGGAIDPRTGEILKGHVNLGSLRVRQDRLIFEGLVGADASGRGGPGDPIQAALARLRQLAAHEVGHALGLDHNFAASTCDRASVMDYPAPRVTIAPDGRLDLSDAYASGIGAWDVQAIRYLYSEPPPGSETQAMLDAILQENLDRGLLFLADQDGRPASAAHPLANMWDNGNDSLAELEHVLAVRRLALARFGPGNVAPGRPVAMLQEVLVPLYFYHRYQLTAAAKLLGGLEYGHAVRGELQPAARQVDPERQRRALTALLALLAPSALDLPDEVLALLEPRPPNHNAHPEMFRGAASPVFDPLAAAASAAELVVAELLQPQRAARMVDFHRRDPRQPGFEEVVEALLAHAFPAAEAGDERAAELQRTVQSVVVTGLIALAGDAAAAPPVRTRAEAALVRLRAGLGSRVRSSVEQAHRAALAAEVARFLDRPLQAVAPAATALPAPPGPPIGGAQLPETFAPCSQLTDEYGHP